MNPINKQVLHSWGANNCGQLGLGSTEDSLMPLSVNTSLPLDRLRTIGGAGAFSFILLEDGSLFTCGNNDKGQQGKQDVKSCVKEFTPLAWAPSPFKVLRVAAGWDFLLALSDSGSLVSWGSNAFGQLGRPTTGGKNYDPSQGHVCFSHNASHVKAMDAGLRHVVAVTDSNIVYTWGYGRRGQLGVLVNETMVQKSNSPLEVSSLQGQTIAQVVAGMYHTAALTNDGTTFVWGCNKYGQSCVSPETRNVVITPEQAQLNHLQQSDKVVALCSGWTHMLALLESGELLSWGRCDLGQLGRPCTHNKPYDSEPTKIPGLSRVKTMTSGSEHNLVLDETGQVFSWGWNEHGICATGDETNIFKPQPIKTFEGQKAVTIGTGAGHSFCIVSRPCLPHEKGDCT